MFFLIFTTKHLRNVNLGVILGVKRNNAHENNTRGQVDMLTVERATLIINMMKVCWLMGKPVTRHSIASEIKSISRSTVYRAVNRMIELRMLSMVPNEKGNLEVSLTSKGQEFIESVKEVF